MRLKRNTMQVLDEDKGLCPMNQKNLNYEIETFVLRDVDNLDPNYESKESQL